MNRYRAGIIGCGNIGGLYDEREDDGNVYTHAGMYRSVEKIDLICAADPDTARIEGFSRFWSPERCYSDHREMLKHEMLDIVSIATPDETHYEIILEVLRCQTPRIIFTEKPLAMNLALAIEAYEACQRKNIALVVDYVRRWDENHCRIKEMVSNGELGFIQSLIGYYVRGIRHNGCQMINTMQYVFGKIVCVKAMSPDNLGSFTGDPSLDIALEFESGFTGYMIALDKFDYGFSTFEIDIFGLNGRLRILNGGQNFEYYKTSIDSQFPNFKKLIRSDSSLEKSTYGAAMKGTGKQLFSFLEGKTNSLHNTAIDAIDDLCVIEAALKSAKDNNRPIPVQRYHN